MKILRAAGSGIFLVVLLVLMPTVFGELVTTIVVALKSMQQALAAAGAIASHAGTLVPPH